MPNNFIHKSVKLTSVKLKDAKLHRHKKLMEKEEKQLKTNTALDDCL
jgi:hypothetical protein